MKSLDDFSKIIFYSSEYLKAKMYIICLLQYYINDINYKSKLYH